MSSAPGGFVVGPRMPGGFGKQVAAPAPAELPPEIEALIHQAVDIWGPDGLKMDQRVVKNYVDRVTEKGQYPERMDADVWRKAPEIVKEAYWDLCDAVDYGLIDHSDQTPEYLPALPYGFYRDPEAEQAFFLLRKALVAFERDRLSRDESTLEQFFARKGPGFRPSAQTFTGDFDLHGPVKDAYNRLKAVVEAGGIIVSTEPPPEVIASRRVEPLVLTDAAQAAFDLIREAEVLAKAATPSWS